MARRDAKDKEKAKGKVFVGNQRIVSCETSGLSYEIIKKTFAIGSGRTQTTGFWFIERHNIHCWIERQKRMNERWVCLFARPNYNCDDQKAAFRVFAMLLSLEVFLLLPPLLVPSTCIFRHKLTSRYDRIPLFDERFSSKTFCDRKERKTFRLQHPRAKSSKLFMSH